MVNAACSGKLNIKQIVIWTMFIGLMFAVEAVFASGGGGGGSNSLGKMASSITDSLKEVGNLITSASYVGGLGFVIGALMKFKQHKDNPTQVPLGTPMTLLVMAIALLFLPTLLKFAAGTIFGSGGATTAGPSGTIISSV